MSFFRVFFGRQIESTANLSLNNAVCPSPMAKDYVVIDIPWAYLPLDMIMEILRCLPVKSLKRFRCVCKEWDSLICSPVFTQLQFHSTSHHPPRRLIVFSELYCSTRNLLAMEVNHHNLKPTPLPDLIVGSSLYDAYALATCNGLICCKRRIFDTFHLYNPLTGYHLQLPDLQLSRFINYSFGMSFDSSSHDYNILVLPYTSDDDLPYIFSLNSFAWRKAPNFGTPYSICEDYFDILVSGLFAWGYLHWLITVGVTRTRRILSFDIHNQTYQSLTPPPNNIRLERSRLYLVGSELGFEKQIVDNDGNKSIVLWMMKEYGRQDSWIKLFQIPYDHLDFVCDIRRHGHVTTYSNGSDYVLLRHREFYYWYDMKSKSSTPLALTEPSKALEIVQSLVSVSVGNPPNLDQHTQTNNLIMASKMSEICIIFFVSVFFLVTLSIFGIFVR